MRALLTFWRQRIHEDKPPSVTEHPCDLTERPGDIVEVVGGQARGHDLEARALEWQSLSRGDEEHGVPNSDFPKDAPCSGKHALDWIGYQHRLHGWSKGKSRMPGTSADIQDALVASGVCEIHHELKISA